MKRKKRFNCVEKVERKVVRKVEVEERKKRAEKVDKGSEEKKKEEERRKRSDCGKGERIDVWKGN